MGFLENYGYPRAKLIERRINNRENFENVNSVNNFLKIIMEKSNSIETHI